MCFSFRCIRLPCNFTPAYRRSGGACFRSFHAISPCFPENACYNRRKGEEIMKKLSMLVLCTLILIAFVSSSIAESSITVTGDEISISSSSDGLTIRSTSESGSASISIGTMNSDDSVPDAIDHEDEAVPADGPSSLEDLSLEDLEVLWEAEERPSVIVPVGTYKIGVDLPAGSYTLKKLDDQMASVSYGSEMRNRTIVKGCTGYTSAMFMDDIASVDIQMEAESFLSIKHHSVLIVPAQ